MLAEAELERQESSTTSARAEIIFETSWKGPDRETVVQKLMDGDPSIRVGAARDDHGIAIIPVNLREGEEEIIASRLREILEGKA